MSRLRLNSTYFLEVSVSFEHELRRSELTYSRNQQWNETENLPLQYEPVYAICQRNHHIHSSFKHLLQTSRRMSNHFSEQIIALLAMILQHDQVPAYRSLLTQEPLHRHFCQIIHSLGSWTRYLKLPGKGRPSWVLRTAFSHLEHDWKDSLLPASYATTTTEALFHYTMVRRFSTLQVWMNRFTYMRRSEFTLVVHRLSSRIVNEQFNSCWFIWDVHDLYAEIYSKSLVFSYVSNKIES